MIGTCVCYDYADGLKMRFGIAQSLRYMGIASLTPGEKSSFVICLTYLELFEPWSDEIFDVPPLDMVMGR